MVGSLQRRVAISPPDSARYLQPHHRNRLLAELAEKETLVLASQQEGRS